MTAVTTPHYNRFAGSSIERIQALSDGVFAVAMTLLVLDLRVPVAAAGAHEDLAAALRDLGPEFAAYLLSFTMLGTFWMAQHTLLGLCARIDRVVSWLQLGYLLVVTLLPFSAALLAEYLTERLAVGLYWLTIALLGLGLALTGRRIRRADLLNASGRERLAVFVRRITVAQAGYALAALLALLSPVAAVVALSVVQLYFIVSPRLPLLDRLLVPRNPPEVRETRDEA